MQLVSLPIDLFGKARNMTNFIDLFEATRGNFLHNAGDEFDAFIEVLLETMTIFENFVM